ncbi:hypothetical protein EON80_24005 [bacterium]|nr:MAG: hypothetical protein EON80_24005 [bacterium]
MGSPEIQQIIDFVEGRLSPKEFEQLLYANPRFEEVLNDNPDVALTDKIWSNLYLFVIEQNFNDPGGILNVHGVLEEFLQRHGIANKSTHVYSKLYDIILEAQPSWLDVDDSYIQKEFLSRAEGREGKELKEWLRAELLKKFRYTGKPPRWIQNPQWPINEHGPLVFFGQVSVKDYFHDEAAVYIFHCPVSGKCHVEMQVY